MIYSKNLWFNPAYLLYCGTEAEKTGISSDMAKAINETRAACIWALAANKLMGVQHLINVVGPREQTPDVRAMLEAEPRGQKKLKWGQYLDVEVVTYGERESKPIDEFLVEKKLSPAAAYEQGTIILCYINKNITDGKLWKDIHRELVSKKLQKLDVFLLGKTHPAKAVYCIGRVYPEFDSIKQIDVLEEAKKKYDEPSGTRIIEFYSDDPNKLALLKRQIPAKGYNPFC